MTLKTLFAFLTLLLTAPVLGKTMPSQKTMMAGVSQRLHRPLILVFDEECQSCLQLVKKISQECQDQSQLKKNLGILAFGQRQKLRAKLLPLKGLQTETHALSQNKNFFIEITPSLWIEKDQIWEHGVENISSYLWDKKNELCHS